MPGSDKQYTEKQIADGFAPPDWFPNEHKPMPPIVANGATPATIACARCHLPTGAGHPEYYATTRATPGYTKVVEKARVPKSRVGENNMRFADEKGGTEKIGVRIIELPQNVEMAKARNPKFGFIADVPPGSIARGSKLAQGVKGKTEPCAVCHGAGLNGLGEVPSPAGRDRSSSYASSKISRTAGAPAPGRRCIGRSTISSTPRT